MYTKRKVIQGVPIAGGIVLGYAKVLLPGDAEVPEIPISTSRVNPEIASLELAVERTITELRNLRLSADKKIGGPAAKLLDAQLLIAGDYEFLKRVKEEIRGQKRNAAHIYNSLVRTTTTPLKASNDEYIRQMAIDVEAVATRVLSHLSGDEQKVGKFPPQTILVGKSFAPSEVLTFRQRKAIGFLVGEGGETSHMALITRALMIPVVLATGAFLEIPNNSRLILDGTKGKVIVHPSESDWSEYQRLKKRQGPAGITRIKRLSTVPPLTRDGKPVNIAANLTLPGPADDILADQRFPVGLYRTEFLYLAENVFPDEESQYQYYSRIAETYKNSTVVLRTFDLGYDKLSEDTAWPGEDNPALGWRGIRVMLEMSHVFKAQIRAILRASTRNNLKIMLPMISDMSELEKARKLISQVKFKLRKQGTPFDENIQIGIMIEVPSAALTAHELAQKADFLSLGTNDLTQYALAADRMNSRVASLYSPFHPSVLKLIEMTVEAGKRFDKPVSVCGEVSGDLMALPLFVGMGMETLSMNPGRIFDVCRLISKIDSEMARHLAVSVIASKSREEVVHKLEDYKSELEKKNIYARRK